MEEFKTFLRDHTDWKSTERIFSLMEQPRNACPHADKVINILDSYNANLSVLKDKLGDIPTSLINEKDIYLFYVNQIDHAMEIISNNTTKISMILEQVEEWRNRCLDARKMFTEDKKILWEIILTRKNPDKLNSMVNELTWVNENVEFDLESIDFEKYEPSCPFFHENFAWLDVEHTFVSLQCLKDIYMDLFQWGNDIVRFIHTYQVENKKYSLSLFNCTNSSDVEFHDIYQAMHYVLKNGLPNKVILNQSQEFKESTELFTAFLSHFEKSINHQ